MSKTTLSVTELPPPTILIVDDDPDIALVLHDLLEHVGYRVSVAGTGAEALAKAKVESLSAVLLDLMLPDMDGLSVLTLLKEIDPVLPIIMLTAFVEVAKKHSFLTEGAFGYLTKPYEPEELKALIRRAVGVQHLSVEAAATKQALTASEDRVLTWNSAAERLFGYGAEEMLRESLIKIVPERYRARHEQALARVRTTGDLRLKGMVVTMHGLHKDGREFPIEMSLSSWISDGQRVHCGIVRDITARKEAEARLVQQQIEQQVLLDLIPAMVWYKDSHNRILRANRRAAESIKKTVAEIEGRSTDEFYPEEAERYHQDDLAVIVSGWPKLGIIEPYRIESGEKRWVQTDKVPYLDPQGNVLGVLVFAQDITERKRTEEALRESADCLRVVLESASNGIIVADAEGKILRANTQIDRRFGYERGELVGQSVECLLPEWLRAPSPEEPSVFRARTEDLSASHVRNLVGVRKDGTELSFSMTLTPLMTTNGKYSVAVIDQAQGTV